MQIPAHSIRSASRHVTVHLFCCHTPEPTVRPQQTGWIPAMPFPDPTIFLPSHPAQWCERSCFIVARNETGLADIPLCTHLAQDAGAELLQDLEVDLVNVAQRTVQGGELIEFGSWQHEVHWGRARIAADMPVCSKMCWQSTDVRVRSYDLGFRVQLGFSVINGPDSQPRSVGVSRKTLPSGPSRLINK